MLVCMTSLHPCIYRYCWVPAGCDITSLPDVPCGCLQEGEEDQASGRRAEQCGLAAGLPSPGNSRLLDADVEPNSFMFQQPGSQPSDGVPPYLGTQLPSADMLPPTLAPLCHRLHSVQASSLPASPLSRQRASDMHSGSNSNLNAIAGASADGGYAYVSATGLVCSTVANAVGASLARRPSAMHRSLSQPDGPPTAPDSSSTLSLHLADTRAATQESLGTGHSASSGTADAVRTSPVGDTGCGQAPASHTAPWVHAWCTATGCM